MLEPSNGEASASPLHAWHLGVVESPIRGRDRPGGDHLGPSYLWGGLFHLVVRIAPYGGSVAPIRHQHPGLHERMARRRRDASLLRVGTITKAIGAGTLAAVGLLGFYVAKAFPGHHTSAPTATAASAGTVQSAVGPAAPSTTPLGGAGPATAPPTTSLTPPTSPPVRTSTQAPVVSGSS